MSRLIQLAEALALGAAIAMIAVTGAYGSAPAPSSTPIDGLQVNGNEFLALQSQISTIDGRISAVDARIGTIDTRMNWLWLFCGGTTVTGGAIGSAIGTARRRHTPTHTTPGAA